jgi:hypothetical protein
VLVQHRGQSEIHDGLGALVQTGDDGGVVIGEDELRSIDAVRPEDDDLPAVLLDHLGRLDQPLERRLALRGIGQVRGGWAKSAIGR